MITKLIKEIGTTEQIVYTCPTDKVSTISRFSITNNSEEEITFDLRYYNATANQTIYLAKNGVLATGGQHINVSNTNTLVLNVNDYITVLSTVDSSIDAIVTYEESDV
jgi:hypothetical protein